MALTISKNTLPTNLRAIALGSKYAIQRALARESEAIMAEAKVLCPVDTGALRGTGRAWPVEWIGKDAIALLTFGGYGVDYTEPVHEILPPRVTHKSPTQAKFLEAPMNGSRFGFMDRIEADLQQWLDKAASK